MNSVCLVVDRLHWGYLGACGNTWVPTPAFNRLAAEGFTWDGAFIESPRLDAFCHACWTGRHAMRPAGPSDAEGSLMKLLSSRGVHCRLLTDDSQVGRHPLASGFDEVVDLHLPLPQAPADTLEQTLLGRYFSQAMELLDSAPEPFLLWCHVGSLGTAWDAPRDFRQAVWDEGDPEPPDLVLPPETILPKDYDPDVLLGFTQVYAAQVGVLDACLEVILDWLAESEKGRQTLLVMASARGFPVGEHLRVGPCDHALYGELTRVPWMFRFPDLSAATDRSDALVQPSDLAPTLCDWHGVPPDCSLGATSLLLPIREGADAWRQCVGILGEGDERAMVTPAWYFRQGSRPELFLRPDDCWNANDVADRCPEIIEAMSSALSAYHRAMESDGRVAMPPLDRRLLVGVE
jgi:N-sulfoglucosamine sulfohydrolase